MPTPTPAEASAGCPACRPDPADVRALTIRQPWASLIACGAKTIETRSWRTDWRGDLLIHAGAAHRPASWVTVGPYKVRGFGRTGLALNGPGLPPFRSTPRLEGYLLRLGAVVAVARLADVVPTDDVYPTTEAATLDPGWRSATSGGAFIHEAQVPLGDFTPGRYAWLLTDVRSLPEPVPAKGRQGLWRPDADLLAAVLGDDDAR